MSGGIAWVADSGRAMCGRCHQPMRAFVGQFKGEGVSRMWWVCRYCENVTDALPLPPQIQRPIVRFPF